MEPEFYKFAKYHLKSQLIHLISIELCYRAIQKKLLLLVGKTIFIYYTVAIYGHKMTA